MHWILIPKQHVSSLIFQQQLIVVLYPSFLLVVLVAFLVPSFRLKLLLQYAQMHHLDFYLPFNSFVQNQHHSIASILPSKFSFLLQPNWPQLVHHWPMNTLDHLSIAIFCRIHSRTLQPISRQSVLSNQLTWTFWEDLPSGLTCCSGSKTPWSHGPWRPLLIYLTQNHLVCGWLD